MSKKDFLIFILLLVIFSFIALLLCTTCVLSSCGKAVPRGSVYPGDIELASPSDIEVPETPDTEDKEEDIPTVTPSDAIDKRINEVGESYDGLCTDEDEDMYVGLNMSSISNSADAVGIAKSATNETADSMIIEEFTPSDFNLDFNTEGYNYVAESGFVSVQAQPFSTFAADVDTASYALVRRNILSDNFDYMDSVKSSIRTEELINYFDYSYDEPEGTDKFGVYKTVAKCPWNKDTMLLHIGIKTKDVKPEKGSNIVFLIDTSGSMFSSNKLPLVQKSFNILQESLTDTDRISIVTYAGSEEVIAEGVKGSDHEKIKKAVDSLVADGYTNGESGINKAYEIAEKYFIKGGNNRVILATDGDLNVGISSEAGLIDLIEEKKKSGIMLSCLGFGDGNYMDDRMEALADHGNGNYAYIDCQAEAKRVLQKEIWATLYTVAKDAKFQVEFNPERIKGYRLIGYENREMAAEDFANDKKDGGEIGAGQTVTVLYEIIPTESEYTPTEIKSKYTKHIETDEYSDELGTMSIRYKEPDKDESVLKEYPITDDDISSMWNDTSWAAGVAEFGMLLRDSEYKGISSYKGIYERLKKDPAVMDDDFKAEFLYLVRKMDDDSDLK